MRNAPAWLVLFIVFMAATSHVLADTRSWTGAADNDWFNILNWNPPGAPASTDQLLVPSGSPSTAATVAASGGGSIHVDGPGASVSFGLLHAGETGNGWVKVLRGAAVSSGQASIGGSAGSSGAATVDGAGSTWANDGPLNVGEGGTGVLTVRSAAAVSNGAGSVGVSAGSFGIATVDGSGSLWTNNLDVTIGDGGVGVLDILNGGQVVAHQQTVIGAADGSQGTVTIDGNSSNLNGDGDLTVGLSGKGSLTIRNGASLLSARAYIGRNSGSTGEVRVDGLSTFWTNSDDLRIGGRGAGVLTILNGASVANAAGHIGSSESGSVAEGSVTAEGMGSSWSNSGDLWVGKVGAGTLQVLAGALVSNVNGEINGSTAAGSSATVSGSGSAWNCSGSLKVAADRQGRLEVLDGGVVNSNSGSIAEGGSSQGIAEVRGAESGWIVYNSLYVGGGESGPVGTGLLHVSAGGQVVVGGVLKVWRTGELRGDGNVAAAVVADGLVNPGESVGLLRIDGTYQQLPGGTLHIELAGTAPGEFGALSISGEGSLDGTLAVDVAAGFHPSLGDTFDIVTAAGIDRTFATVEGSDLGGGLWLNVVYSDTTVQLEVVPEPATLSLLALGGLAVIRRRR